ncbi:hypothetical protein Hdeb2414_s0025g00667011 [Helianthus debilis subsp. tardiflorus]
MRGAPCGVRPLGSLPCGVRPLGSLPCGVRRLGSLPCGVRRLGSLPCGVRPLDSLPCGVRRLGSLPCGMRRVTMRRAATWLKPVHARCGGAASWLTSVHAAVRRAPRHCRTHAPCTQPRASYTRARMRMSATSCAASPTTWSLQPLCFTPRARSKIQRRLSSGSRRCERAKCKVRHQSATLRLIAHATRARARVRVRVRVRVLRTLREDTSVCFHETIRMESSTLNTHLSSISPPMWDKVLLSL